LLRGFVYKDCCTRKVFLLTHWQVDLYGKLRSQPAMDPRPTNYLLVSMQGRQGVYSYEASQQLLNPSEHRLSRFFGVQNKTILFEERGQVHSIDELAQAISGIIRNQNPQVLDVCRSHMKHADHRSVISYISRTHPDILLTYGTITGMPDIETALPPRPAREYPISR